MTKQLKLELATFSPIRSLFAILVIVAATYALSLVLPDDSAQFGPAALIPAVFLIVYIFIVFFYHKLLMYWRFLC